MNPILQKNIIKILYARSQKRLFVNCIVLALILVFFQLLFTTSAFAFQIGDRVKTTRNLNVRNCTFLWCDVIGVIPQGSTGKIIAGSYFYDNYTWWSITWDNGLTGFSVQNYLTVIPGTFSLSHETPVCDTNPPGPSPAVRLNWTTSSNATYYDVYRNGSLYASSNTGNTYYNSLNLVAGRSYTYYIKARSSSGSQNSNTISVSIPSNICDSATKPASFTLNQPSTSCNSTNPQISLSWGSSSNATSYKVYRNGAYYDNAYTNLTYKNTSVVSGTTYSYFIRASNSAGYRDSNTVTATAPNCVADPQITIGPPSLNFTSVQTGSCSQAHFAIQHIPNTGAASGTVTVSQNPPFRVTSNSSFSLSNGQAVNVNVEFCPASSGSFSGTAIISSNAAQNINSVSLSGTGSTPSPTTGVIQVKAKLDGTSWSGSVNYSISGAQNFSGNSVPADFQSRPQGNYTLAYVSGGPANATFTSITPSSSQTLNGGSVIIYTLNFTSSSIGILDHFVFSNISSPQTVGTPFSITITAADAGGRRVLTFNDSVWLRSNIDRVYPTNVNLVNGQATVSVRIDYDGTYKLTCSGGASGYSNFFEVGSGATCNGKISGSVIDAKEAPIYQANVELYDSSDKRVNQIQTDTAGKYSFSGLCTDTYRVEVKKEDFNVVVSENEVTGAMGVQLNEIQLQINGGTGVIPVVLVPGMMGSTTLSHYPIPTLSGLPPCDNLVLYDYNWKAFLNIGEGNIGWKKLQSVLTDDFKWEPCPWDWRMEIQKGPIKSLKKKIDDALNLPGVTGTKVHIVAHSMGGLLVRAYIQGDDYRGDIAKVAFVGTPHLGSCDPYYIWEGGNPLLVDNIKDSGWWESLENPYKKTLATLWGNYNPLSWELILIPKMTRNFVHKKVESLRQLMYTEAFLYDEAEGSIRDVDSSGNENTWLNDLNKGGGVYKYKNPNEVMSPDGAGNTVEARLFVGNKSNSTIHRVRTKGKGKTGDLYEDGIPTWPKRWSAIKGTGDGTVPYDSATWPSEDGWAYLYEPQLPHKHSSLIKDYKDEIVNFLQGTSTSDTKKEIPSSEETAVTANSVLTCFVFGDMRLFVTNAAGQKTGIDPSTQTPVDNIPSSSSSFSVESGGVSVENPDQNVYSVTYFGERNQDFRLNIGYTDDTSTETYNFQGFRPSSSQIFTVSVNPTATPRITITPPAKAPSNLQANPYTDSSTEKTRLIWTSTGESGLTGYNVYAVAELEPYFTKVTTVGAGTTSYNTADVWSSTASTAVMTYAIAAVKTGGIESFFSNLVQNNDRDHDGLTDAEEPGLGTDPTNADTDGDGLKDGDEQNYGTNPLVKDTDEDGYNDYVEIKAGTDPLDPQSAPAATLYVEPSGACGGKQPCYSTIQAAMNASKDGDTIKVCQGAYKEAPVRSTTGAVTISGGWNSTFTGQTGTTGMYAPRATGGGAVKMLPNIRVVAP